MPLEALMLQQREQVSQQHTGCPSLMAACKGALVQLKLVLQVLRLASTKLVGSILSCNRGWPCAPVGHIAWKAQEKLAQC